MHIFEKQVYHYIALAVLLTGLYLLADEATLAGQYFGWPASRWLSLSIAIPILHQIYVWLLWRTELKY